MTGPSSPVSHLSASLLCCLVACGDSAAATRSDTSAPVDAGAPADAGHTLDASVADGASPAPSADSSSSTSTASDAGSSSEGDTGSSSEGDAGSSSEGNAGNIPPGDAGAADAAPPAADSAAPWSPVPATTGPVTAAVDLPLGPNGALVRMTSGLAFWDPHTPDDAPTGTLEIILANWPVDCADLKELPMDAMYGRILATLYVEDADSPPYFFGAVEDRYVFGSHAWYSIPNDNGVIVALEPGYRDGGKQVVGTVTVTDPYDAAIHRGDPGRIQLNHCGIIEHP